MAVCDNYDGWCFGFVYSSHTNCRDTIVDVIHPGRELEVFPLSIEVAVSWRRIRYSLFIHTTSSTSQDADDTMVVYQCTDGVFIRQLCISHLHLSSSCQNKHDNLLIPNQNRSGQFNNKRFWLQNISIKMLWWWWWWRRQRCADDDIVSRKTCTPQNMSACSHCSV